MSVGAGILASSRGDNLAWSLSVLDRTERLGAAKLREELSGIDGIVGVFARDEITKVADRLFGLSEEQRTVFRPAPVKALDDRARLRITPRHYAYLKISEGCDRTCTFCAIPKMRGKLSSGT